MAAPVQNAGLDADAVPTETKNRPRKPTSDFKTI